ncbi:hypothetical protein K525DRAFT_286094 [Schizophyllum commune Loenen D]|nr:hypothetical protein K525DRAFT_286094 [Schizophyllum commune Loenen D]
MSSTPPSPKAGEDSSPSQQNVTEPADGSEDGEPKVPQPSERLDLYHETFPRDVVPPPMAAVVLGTKPPLYYLGWRYRYGEIRKRFNNGRCEDPAIIFRQRILPLFAEQYPEFANTSPSAQNLARNDMFVEAVKVVLNEDREPVWYRHPPR